MFKLEFSTENAAFEGDLAGEEIARILREAADTIERHHTGVRGLTIRDINGNRLGSWSYEPAASDDED